MLLDVDKSLQADVCQSLLNTFEPAKVFSRFVSYVIGGDHSVLLDYLLGDETTFLQFLLKFARYYITKSQTEKPATDAAVFRGAALLYRMQVDVNATLSEPEEQQEEEDMEDSEEDDESIMLAALSLLREKVESLVAKNLFPYNAAPLVKRLKQIETAVERLWRLDAKTYSFKRM